MSEKKKKREVSELFMLIAALAVREGGKDISDHEGCWEHDINEKWRVAVNGHEETVKTEFGLSVPPYAALITHLDFPVGILNAVGGHMLYGVEDNLIKRLKKMVEA